MPERRKKVLQNTKTRAATFACCRRFPQKRAITFSVRTGPDALPHLPMPPGYLPFLHCHLIFYFFSIFCIQHISVSLPATFTRSRQHIPLSFCLLPELYAFIIFSFEVFSFFRNPSHLLPAPAGRHPTQHSYPSTNQNLAFRLAGYTLPASFSFKALSAFHQPLHTLPAPAGRHITSIILIPQKPFHLYPASPASTTPPAPNQLPTLPPDALPHLPMPPGYLLSPPLCRRLPLLKHPILFFFLFISSTIFLFFFFFLSSTFFLFLFSFFLFLLFSFSSSLYFYSTLYFPFSILFFCFLPIASLFSLFVCTTTKTVKQNAVL